MKKKVIQKMNKKIFLFILNININYYYYKII